MTALVQRAACECRGACRCCELPADALALPLDILVVELGQNIHRLLKSTPLSLYARCLCLYIMQPMHIECISALLLLHYCPMHIECISALFLLHCCFTCLYKCFSSALLLLYSYFTCIYMHVHILLLYSCISNACLAVCVHIYALLLLYSGFTYNKYNIYNLGIYSCLKSFRTKAFHIQAL